MKQTNYLAGTELHKKYLTLKTERTKRLSELETMQKGVDKLTEKVIEMESMINPVVTISVAKSPYSGKIYLARCFVKKGSQRIAVNGYIGKAKDFPGGRKNAQIEKKVHEKMEAAMKRKFNIK